MGISFTQCKEMLSALEHQNWFNYVFTPFFIELQKNNWFKYVLTPTDEECFEYWPIEMKLEALNLILILYNLHLIAEDVFFEKYASKIAEYSDLMEDLKEFVE